MVAAVVGSEAASCATDQTVSGLARQVETPPDVSGEASPSQASPSSLGLFLSENHLQQGECHPVRDAGTGLGCSHSVRSAAFEKQKSVVHSSEKPPG